jgi:hypothetical protein
MKNLEDDVDFGLRRLVRATAARLGIPDWESLPADDLIAKIAERNAVAAERLLDLADAYDSWFRSVGRSALMEAADSREFSERLKARGPAFEVLRRSLAVTRNVPIEDLRSDELGVGRGQILAQFYVAEYSALMGRVTMWTTLQYSLWPIVLWVIYLLIQLYNRVPSPWLAWIAAAIVPIGYIAFQSAMVDALNSVLLIESRLRPLAAKLVDTQLFWLHERVHRMTKLDNPAFWKYWPPVVSFGWGIVTFGLVVFLDKGVSDLDWIGLGINAALGVAVAFLTRRGSRLEDEINKSVRNPLEGL